ncbi:MAG: 6-phosphogluconolactonase [Anaerolineae bacterium]
MHVEVYPDSEALAHGAATHFVRLAAAAIAEHGRFSVALAGGSTPEAMHRALASEAFAPRVDWERVHVFWGDERCVPPDHAESNYRMARETLLDGVPIPARNVHRMRAEIGPEAAADEYEAALRAFFGADGPPRLDLIFLGMGDDGHTASLFPGTAAVHETAGWVAAHHVAKLGAWRVTLTPAVLNAAANVIFLVAGAHKAARLREVLHGPYQPDALPAQVVKPAAGRLLWLVDQAAVA